MEDPSEEPPTIVASSGSSTYEGASDVSLSHLFHPLPLHLPVGLSFCGCFGLGCGLFCFLFPLVLQVQGVLDDFFCSKLLG